MASISLIKTEGDFFNLETMLSLHGWHPELDHGGAEHALRGCKPFTYLLRKRRGHNAFFLSYISTDGAIYHDKLRLIDGRSGVFRNGGLSHVGPLEKVLFTDMMKCDPSEARPLR